MPLRPIPSPYPLPFLLRQRQARQFHETPTPFSTSKSNDGVGDYEGKNYYEILQVPRNASAKEIKKSFYTLSKTHHPDHNPTDPTASTRFVILTTAYNTLSSPSNRLTYDSQTFPAASSSSSFTPHHPQGSHFSSSGPAGGRSPSGLSRRKTQFRGPPPSFYRSGGWGDQSPKRESYWKGGPEQQQNNNASSSSSSPSAGPSPNPRNTNTNHPDPTSNPRVLYEEIPHFNYDSHFATQSAQDRRRRARNKRMRILDQEALGQAEREGMGGLGSFLWVSGIVGFAVVVGTLVRWG